MANQVATVVEWFKEPGQEVSEGEVIGEAEAEKTTVEIVAPVAGTLMEIRVPAGEEIPVRTVVAVIGAPAGEPGTRSRVEVTPAARRLAKEHKVELGDVRGTGPGGRITEDDVRHLIAPAIGPAAAEVIPLRGTRGTVARRMLSSLQTAAQFTLTTDADVTDAMLLRERLKADLGVTYTHLVIRACVLALQEHPRLNAVVTEGEVRVMSQVNIGVAVPRDEGLVVPVVRDTAAMDIRQLVEGVQAAVDEARQGHASPERFSEGTFTVSNLGPYGIDAFTPILNPPEVAILGVGRITTRPAPAADGVVWRQAMALSLTVDHRAVDGVPAARFLRSVVGYLEAPQLLVDGARL